MCGIIGMISEQHDTVTKTIESLKKLEYRGYDSSGIAIYDEQEITLYRAVGKIAELEKTVIENEKVKTAIAHTRWATHGKATIENAHPHHSTSKRIYLVHNGTIENYLALKEKYCDDNQCYGQTDSEVIAQILAYFIKVEKMFMQDALRRLTQELEGGYALVIIDQQMPNQLFFAKNKSPLIIGQNGAEKFIASDILAIEAYANQFIEIDDLTFGEIAKDHVTIWNQAGKKVDKHFMLYEINDTRKMDKAGHEYFMMKEIHEQPDVLRRIATNYVIDDAYTFAPTLIQKLQTASQINIIAAGTSYHAGLVISNIIQEKLAQESFVYIASEFTYGHTPIHDDAIYFFFSQSGETADSRAALQKIKTVNSRATIVTVTNVISSTLAREADYVLDILAGVEVAVASTKAYVAQIATVLGLIYCVATEHPTNYTNMLMANATAIEKILTDKEQYLTYAHEHLLEATSVFYIGRIQGYALAVEAALKLKEISYIQTEGFAAGELKHGTIALIEEGTPIIAFIPETKTAGLTRSNIEEVKARSASVFIISSAETAHVTDDVIIESVDQETLVLSMIVPAQLIAYYATVVRDLDVDMPRNLAKSVTVE